MILKAPNKGGLDKRVLLWILIPTMVVITFYQVVNFASAPNDESSTVETVFNCDLEEIAEDQFTTEGFKFAGAIFRSSDYARSGSHSIALNNQNIYGLTTTFKPQNKEATYHLSVWRYNPDNVDSWLVVTALDPRDLYIAQKDAKETGKRGWEQLHVVFQVPANVDSVKLYCYATGNGENVYFDDLNLEITDLSQIARKFDLPKIDLTVEPHDFDRLKEKRDQAWDQGILVKSDDDWVKAKVSIGEDQIKAKIRLKGDWLDHLRGTKWSFRMEIKDPDALWGMKTINLQKPETRGFIREWVYHEMLFEQGILSPRYRFAVVTINDRVLGLYAVEEHFEKELIESQFRREGPIIKFSEDRFWSGVKRQFDELGKARFLLNNDKKDAYWASEVGPFNEKQIAENPVLLAQYQRGAFLLSQFKYASDSLEYIFDTELVGKYLAVIELTGAYHNLTWHNQRWYYNPLTDRLEPIGFDGFTDRPPILQQGSTILADDAYKTKKDRFEPFRKLFYCPEIVTAYTRALDSLSGENYRSEFWSKRQPEIDQIKNAIVEEYSGFTFDVSEYEKRSKTISMSIHAHDGFGLLAQTDGETLFCTNKHHLPLVLVSSKGDALDIPIIYPSLEKQNPTSIQINPLPEVLHYRVLGLDSIYSSSVSIIPIPHKSLAQGFLISNFRNHPQCEVIQNDVILKSGVCKTPIIVETGYQVIIPPGTNLDFVEHAYLSSSSPLFAQGTEEDKISIHSSDGTGAFLVKQSGLRSELSYVNFEGMGTIKTDGYTLTGAVTFYESAVDIDHCFFHDSREEDALNIVRSDFSVSQSLFDLTAFDAFDADFCSGSISNCVFRNTGNDAMDFSGSRVDIDDCYLTNIGDKGVSVGEDSEVFIGSIEIDKAPVGVAAKDLSHLLIDYISLKNVNTGFTAFQKKATFGPATIEVHNYEASNVDHLHIIEAGSSLQLSGHLVSMNQAF